MTLSSAAKIGPVMQLAFVPENFEQAIEYWTQVMGVGPFFLIPQAGLSNVRFNGQPAEADFGLAISYWGDVQIELIKPNSNAPSIFNTAQWKTDRLHHICVTTRNFDAAVQVLAEQGGQIVMSGEQMGGYRVIYADMGGPQGLLEVLETNDQIDGFFGMMRKAAQNWDGKDPIRVMP